MANVEEIKRLRQICEEYGLEGSELLVGRTDEELARLYNGIGPEFLPPALREMVTKWLHLFEPAALIHDARTHESNGMLPLFCLANAEFHINCRRLADRAYPWWNWKRYRARLVADALYDCVSSPAGWEAWQQAHEAALARNNHPENPDT